jgi:hypothetical protein
MQKTNNRSYRKKRKGNPFVYNGKGFNVIIDNKKPKVEVGQEIYVDNPLVNIIVSLVKELTKLKRQNKNLQEDSQLPTPLELALKSSIRYKKLELENAQLKKKLEDNVTGAGVE